MPAVAKKASLKSPEKRHEHIRRLLRLRRQAGAKYDKVDALLKKLKVEMAIGEPVPYFDYQAILKDNYAGTDKVYRAHGIGRFELEIRDLNGKVIKNPPD